MLIYDMQENFEQCSKLWRWRMEKLEEARVDVANYSVVWQTIWLKANITGTACVTEVYCKITHVVWLPFWQELRGFLSQMASWLWRTAKPGQIGRNLFQATTFLRAWNFEDDPQGNVHLLPLVATSVKTCSIWHGSWKLSPNHKGDRAPGDEILCQPWNLSRVLPAGSTCYIFLLFSVLNHIKRSVEFEARKFLCSIHYAQSNLRTTGSLRSVCEKVSLLLVQVMHWSSTHKTLHHQMWTPQTALVVWWSGFANAALDPTALDTCSPGDTCPDMSCLQARALVNTQGPAQRSRSRLSCRLPDKAMLLLLLHIQHTNQTQVCQPARICTDMRSDE